MPGGRAGGRGGEGSRWLGSPQGLNPFLKMTWGSNPNDSQLLRVKSRYDLRVKPCLAVSGFGTSLD